YDGTPHGGGAGLVTGPGTITGSATLSYSGDQVNAGTYYATAHYAGDRNHLSSDGTAVAITIKQAPLPVVVTSDMMLVGSTPPALTGTVNGSPFTGSKTFTDHGNSLTVTLSSTVRSSSSVGVYAITASVTGTGSANYLPVAAGSMYVVSVGADSGTGARNFAF